MVRLSKFGCGLGAPSRDDRLREAAALHLKLGNTRRYCQLLIELGEVGGPPLSSSNSLPLYSYITIYNDYLCICNFHIYVYIHVFMCVYILCL